MPVDVRLVAIADAAILAGRDLVAAAGAAAAGGATAIQLRMKDGGAGAMLETARRLREALSIPLYINDRADVAWASGAHGVHVGADDVPAGALRAISPTPFRIGVSVGSEAEAAAVQAADADYWSIGPVFPTASKADAGVAIGPSGFSRLARWAPSGMPVIGIGGIDAANVPGVIAAGAAGVAVLSAIFAAADVRAAAEAIRQSVDRALALRS